MGPSALDAPRLSGDDGPVGEIERLGLPEPPDPSSEVRSADGRRRDLRVWLAIGVLLVLIIGVALVARVLDPKQTLGACPARPSSSGSAAVTTGSGSGTAANVSAPRGPSTALDIARELPAMPSSTPPGLQGSDTWYAFSFTANSEDSTVSPHVLTAARRGWAIHNDIDLTGNTWPQGGTMKVLVFDSPAARLTAEQSVPTGVFKTPKAGYWYRCFADCGPVSFEVLASDYGSSKDFRAWVDDAVAAGQTRLESIFGSCPASDDVSNPPTAGTWPPFASSTTVAGSVPSG